MIKIGKTRVVRECTAPYEYSDDKGERKVDEIAVQYYCFTTADIKASRIEAQTRRKEDPGYVPYDTEFLLPRLHALPELADEKGKALSKDNGNLTVENLDKIETVNITAIWKAIETDLAPKEQPSK
ncbi:MAG: hypothetical protein IPL32_19920 [Chloracidobacterium sp.]|nr:hypothetical protein [Chloracidobacterium sp.]